MLRSAPRRAVAPLGGGARLPVRNANREVRLSRELELESVVSVDQAARLKGVSRDTFKRTYAHLIRKISPRRNGVKLRDALA